VGDHAVVAAYEGILGAAQFVDAPLQAGDLTAEFQGLGEGRGPAAGE
jgi:hypothetical protein